MEDWVWVRRPNEGDLDWWRGSMNDGYKEEAKDLKVVFTDPAKHWTDAAPIGNGRLGAMIYGGVNTEILQLNDDTLWTGVPGDYTNSQAPNVLSKVRKLVDNGQFAEASVVANDLLGQLSEAYQPLGNMNLDFGDSHVAYSVYGRELDLATATVKVSYAIDDVEFTREHFCSNPHQVLVTKISSNKLGSLSFTISLDSELQHHSRVNLPNQIIMEGSCPAKRIAPKGNASGNPQGILFSAIIDLQIGGDAGVIHAIDDGKLKAEGADWAVLLLSASSSFEGPFTKPSDSKTEPTLISLNTLNVIRDMSFHTLLNYHLDDYQHLFNRVHLQLSRSSSAAENGLVTFANLDNIEEGSITHCERLKSSEYAISIKSAKNFTVSTAERVQSFNVNEDPSLVELLFHFGRYLLISCSRPRTQVANLQGIWSKEIEPAWEATPHLNINLQMNYWPSLSCNLSECQEPLFDYIASLAVNGAKTAKVNYDASGWVTHHVSDIWARTSPDNGKPVWAMWPMGGAWLCTHLWEHYSFTLDKVLGRSDSSLISQIKTALPKLPPTRVSWDGSIMEWAQDFEDPEVHHRHLSHLFGLFPGHTITLENTPDLCKAAAISLYKRGDEGPGWSTTWKMALWAHLQDSKHAYKLIKQLINLVDPNEKKGFRGGLYSNLFTAHPPFQIDANFGFTAAIAEMLVQSTMEDLYLLPALPRDKWPEGSVRGLKARGGVTVNIRWKEGELHEARLCSKSENSVKRLHYNGKVAAVELSKSCIHVFDKHLKCLETYPF